MGPDHIGPAIYMPVSAYVRRASRRTYVQGRVTLRTLVGDGRPRARLEVQVDVPALLVDVLDHPPERLLVERLAP